nr:BTB/POZ and MATH domain-containing protein 1-like [Aegilops tauschii subsp. strangulata]
MAYLWFLSPAGLVDTKYTLSVLGNEGEESAASFGVLEGVFSAVEPNNCWGTELKPLSELGDGGFTLQYVLTVINVESRPMELPGHLERMLANGRRADVRFRVRGRNFRAHSSILAERSPVFEAQLFGPMAEKDMRRIKVVGGRSAAVMQRLLVAADRYGLDRLKLMCEEELCRRIDAETIMSMHALANRHHCHLLKHECLLFLTRSPEVLGTVLESSGFNELCMTNYRPLPLEGESHRQNVAMQRKKLIQARN